MALSQERIEELNEKYGIKPAGNKELAQRLRSAWDTQPEEKEGFFHENISDQGSEIATGFTKSLLSTAKGLGSLAQGAGQRIMAGIDPTRNLEQIRKDTGFDILNSDTEISQKADEFLESKSGLEKIGAFGSEVAQFAVPFSKVAKLTKGKGLLKRSLAEGVAGGTVEVAQEGGIDTDTRDTAIISALFPVAGKGLTSVKNFIKSPENGARLVNSLIKPLLKDFSYGKNPGRAVAEEGIVASSLDELAQKIGERRQSIGQEIRHVLENAGDIKIDISDVLAPIDEALTQATKNPRTNTDLIRRLQNVKDDLLGVSTSETGEGIVTRNLKDVSALDATQFKQDIGDITKFTGNASDDALVNKSLKQTYGKIKEKVNQAVPEVAPLNERYADLTSAEIATKYRDKIAERQSIISFDTKSTGLGSALITAIATGGATIPTILVGLGTAGAKKAMETPMAKTALAKWLANSTPIEKKAVYKSIPWLKAAILKNMVNDSDE